MVQALPCWRSCLAKVGRSVPQYVAGGSKGDFFYIPWRILSITRPVGTFQSMLDRNKKISLTLCVLANLNTLSVSSLLKNSQWL